MLQSLSIVIELFYQTLGVLSQDGLLRFIDIHACKQLFEIGGADEVLYPNEKVLICSPFLFYFFIILFFFFSWLGLLFLYIYSPNAGPLSFLFLWAWTSVFYSFYPSLTVSCFLFNGTFPQQAKLIKITRTCKPKCMVITPLPPTLPKMSLISFSIGMTVIPRRNWKQWFWTLFLGKQGALRSTCMWKCWIQNN